MPVLRGAFGDTIPEPVLIFIIYCFRINQAVMSVINELTKSAGRFSQGIEVFKYKKLG